MAATIEQITDPAWVEQVARNAFVCESDGRLPDAHPHDYALYWAGFSAAIDVFALWFRTGQIARSHQQVTQTGADL